MGQGEVLVLQGGRSWHRSCPSFEGQSLGDDQQPGLQALSVTRANPGPQDVHFPTSKRWACPYFPLQAPDLSLCLLPITDKDNQKDALSWTNPRVRIPRALLPPTEALLATDPGGHPSLLKRHGPWLLLFFSSIETCPRRLYRTSAS